MRVSHCLLWEVLTRALTPQTGTSPQSPKKKFLLTMTGACSAFRDTDDADDWESDDSIADECEGSAASNR